MSFELASGAEGRWTGPPGAKAVVCVNGGTAAVTAGTWSASIEWLVRRVAPRFPRLGFLEVRYRLKSWRRLELCVEDARAAIAAARERGAEEIALLGFSMGGAVAVQVAGDPSVSTVIGLAPWLYPELDISPLDGRRLAIVHGALDRGLPGMPASLPSCRGAATSARGRAASMRCGRRWPGRCTRSRCVQPGARSCRCPRARRFAELVGRELELFCA